MGLARKWTINQFTRYESWHVARTVRGLAVSNIVFNNFEE